MSAVAERQSVTRRRAQPALLSDSTRLCPSAKSAIVAPCSGNGAQTSVGVWSRSSEKSCRRTDRNSSATRVGPGPVRLGGFLGRGAGRQICQLARDGSSHLARRRRRQRGPQESRLRVAWATHIDSSFNKLTG